MAYTHARMRSRVYIYFIYIRNQPRGEGGEMTKRRWDRKRQRIVVPRPKRLRDSRPRRRNKRRRASDEWLTRVYADTRLPRRETFSINYVLETGRGLERRLTGTLPDSAPRCSEYHEFFITEIYTGGIR